MAETQQPNQLNDVLRRTTLIVGCLTALAILAVTVTLLRTEASTEGRSLAAIGAPRTIRRRIAATTTGFLALGAALLALPAGYLALLAIMADKAAGYPFVMPLETATILLLGVPLLGSAGAYLLTSKETNQLARSHT